MQTTDTVEIGFRWAVPYTGVCRFCVGDLFSSMSRRGKPQKIGGVLAGAVCFRHDAGSRCSVGRLGRRLHHRTGVPMRSVVSSVLVTTLAILSSPIGRGASPHSRLSDASMLTKSLKQYTILCYLS